VRDDPGKQICAGVACGEKVVELAGIPGYGFAERFHLLRLPFLAPSRPALRSISRDALLPLRDLVIVKCAGLAGCRKLLAKRSDAGARSGERGAGSPEYGFTVIFL
jgi:hypothetical protein